ncbi:MAG: hypothetical protein WC877_01925 [Dehalococcoidales bacterium]|jgi:hypothetical protein
MAKKISIEQKKKYPVCREYSEFIDRYVDGHLEVEINEFLTALNHYYEREVGKELFSRIHLFWYFIQKDDGYYKMRKKDYVPEYYELYYREYLVDTDETNFFD